MAFGKPLYRAGFLQRGTLLRLGVAQISYMLFGADEDSLERARDQMLDLVSGWHRAEIDAIVAQTLDEVIEPLVFAEALFLIDEHKRAGREVYVVSASPEEFVRPIAALVGIDRVIATKIRTDGLGRYVPELERSVSSIFFKSVVAAITRPLPAPKSTAIKVFSVMNLVRLTVRIVYHRPIQINA